MIFILGIITGLLLSMFFMVCLIWLKSPAERKMRQIESRLQRKGVIIEPENEEVTSWVETLPKE